MSKSRKIVVIGEAGSGKTKLARALAGGSFSESTVSTKGIDASRLSTGTYVWEVGGDADPDLLPHYMLGVKKTDGAVILTFDSTKPLEEQLNKFKKTLQRCDFSLRYILAFTKTDLQTEGTGKISSANYARAVEFLEALRSPWDEGKDEAERIKIKINPQDIIAFSAQNQTGVEQLTARLHADRLAEAEVKKAGESPTAGPPKSEMKQPTPTPTGPETVSATALESHVRKEILHILGQEQKKLDERLHRARSEKAELEAKKESVAQLVESLDQLGQDPSKKGQITYINKQIQELNIQEINKKLKAVNKTIQEINKRLSPLKKTIQGIEHVLSQVRSAKEIPKRAAVKALERPINDYLASIDKSKNSWSAKLSRALLKAILVLPVIKKLVTNEDSRFFSPRGKAYDTAKKARDALGQELLREKNPSKDDEPPPPPTHTIVYGKK